MAAMAIAFVRTEHKNMYGEANVSPFQMEMHNADFRRY